MDLVDVLIDARVTADGAGFRTVLGTPALERYYVDLHARYMPEHTGERMVRVALHFAVQQLATRSYARPEQERALLIGGFSACDLAAALLDTVPHTRVQWVPGFSDVTAADASRVIEVVRTRLPADGLPRHLDISDQSWQTLAAGEPDGSYGLITLFSDRNIKTLVECVAELRRLLNPRGRVVVFEALSGGRRPTDFAAPDFAGRYFMSGSGPVRTLAITVLPALVREPAA